MFAERNYRISLLFILLFLGQNVLSQNIYRPIVNQAGYNLNEVKRFVCYGAKNGKKFQIISAKDSLNTKAKVHFSGVIKNYAGDFTINFTKCCNGSEL